MWYEGRIFRIKASKSILPSPFVSTRMWVLWGQEFLCILFVIYPYLSFAKYVKIHRLFIEGWWVPERCPFAYTFVCATRDIFYSTNVHHDTHHYIAQSRNTSNVNSPFSHMQTYWSLAQVFFKCNRLEFILEGCFHLWKHSLEEGRTL